MSTVYGITPAFKGISAINNRNVSFGDEPATPPQDPPVQPDAEQQAPPPPKKSHLLLWLAGLAAVGAGAFFLLHNSKAAEKKIVQATKDLMEGDKKVGSYVLHHTDDADKVVSKIEITKLDKDGKPVVDKDGKPVTETITDPAKIKEFLEKNKVEGFKAPEVKPADAPEIKNAKVTIGGTEYTVNYTEKDGVKTITTITYKTEKGTVTISKPEQIKEHYEKLSPEDKEKLKDYKLPEVKPAEESK